MATANIIRLARWVELETRLQLQMSGFPWGLVVMWAS